MTKKESASGWWDLPTPNIKRREDMTPEELADFIEFRRRIIEKYGAEEVDLVMNNNSWTKLPIPVLPSKTEPKTDE